MSTLDRLAWRNRELAQRLNSISPLAILSRGYAIVSYADDGTVGDVRLGDALDTRLADGSFRSRVEP